jgi:DNA-binding response OmpR family regulator
MSMNGMNTTAKVLIVEDELIVANSMAENLEKAGFEVALASSSRAALESVERNSPDLILMDIRIDGPVDGIDTAVHIRKQLCSPIIFLTAHGDAETMNRARAAGPSDYLTKPVHHTKLMAAIDGALSNRRICACKSRTK